MIQGGNFDLLDVSSLLLQSQSKNLGAEAAGGI